MRDRNDPVHSQTPDAGAGLISAVHHRALESPTEVAFTDGARNWVTYERLWTLAAAVDDHATLGPARRVAVVGDPSSTLSALIAAVYLSGREFLVIERGETIPVQCRLAAEFGAEAVLCEGVPSSDLCERFPTVSDAELGRGPKIEGQRNRRFNGHPRTLHAYCVRTSGTTGEPKLIEISRETIEQFCAESVARYRLDERETIAVWAQPTYDAHYHQLFSALLSGAAGVVANAAVGGDGKATGEWLDRHRITHFQATPSVVRRLASAIAREDVTFPSQLRSVLCFGERFPSELARDMFDHAARVGRQIRLHNEYGPSECILATWHEITADDVLLPDLPVGAAIAGRTVTVESPDGNAASADEPGEIVIESQYLSRGYGAADVGQNVDFPTRGALRVFRTGDLGYFDEYDRLRFKGRRDRVVKRRGVRISLDDLEAAVVALPAVRAAAARAIVVDDGDVRIWIWARTDDGGTSEDDLRRELTKVLELRYLPERIVVIDEELPRLPSGKVDYQNLPHPREESPYLGPTTPADTVLAGVFSEVLGGIPVSGETHFFASGGHSLLALELAARVEQELGVPLTLRDVLENPTVADLGRVLESLRCLRDASVVAQRVVSNELTAAERPIWTWCQLFPRDGSANLVAGFCTRAPITEDSLRSALRGLVEDTDQLRLRYQDQGGVLTRVVAAPQDPSIVVVTLPERAGSYPHSAVNRHIYAPFDTAKDQLVRAVMVRSTVDTDDVAIYLVVHHVICDGRGLSLLLDGLKERLAGCRPTRLLSECNVGAKATATRNPETAKQFWLGLKDRLRDVPCDERLRPTSGTAISSPLAWRVPHQMVRRVADEHHLTRSSVLIALVAVAVGRLLGAPRIAVETPVTLRTGTDMCSIGNYAVDVPIVVEARVPSVDNLAGPVNQALLDSMEFAESAPGFGRSRPGQGVGPVGDVVVVLEDAPPPTFDLDGERATPIFIPGSPPRHALACYFRAIEGRDDILCTIWGRSDGTLAAALPAALDSVLSEHTRAHSATSSQG